MIWVIGGTRDARVLLERLEFWATEMIVTVTTPLGVEAMGWKNTVACALNKEEMAAFIDIHRIAAIVDCSHPFAVAVTENAKEVSKAAGIDYLRYVRPQTAADWGIVTKSYEEARKVLENVTGTVLFTTGSNRVAFFEAEKRDKRYVYRVLPTVASIEKCESAGVAPRDIIAMMGSFSVEANGQHFRDYGVSHMVTKNSGAGSGFEEKMEAAKRSGVIPIVIERATEQGVSDLDEVVERIRPYLSQENHPFESV